MKKVTLLLSFVIFSIACNDQKTGIEGNNNTDNQIIIGNENQIKIEPPKEKRTVVAPINTIVEIGLSTSIDYIKELHGQPKLIEPVWSQLDGDGLSQEQKGNILTWNFENLKMQVYTYDDKSTERITYTLIENSNQVFTLPSMKNINLPDFGNLTVDDLDRNGFELYGHTDPNGYTYFNTEEVIDPDSKQFIAVTVIFESYGSDLIKCQTTYPSQCFQFAKSNYIDELKKLKIRSFTLEYRGD